MGYPVEGNSSKKIASLVSESQALILEALNIHETAKAEKGPCASSPKQTLQSPNERNFEEAVGGQNV